MLGFFNPYNIKCSGRNHNSDTSEHNLKYVFIRCGNGLACPFRNSVSSLHYIAGDGRMVNE
jgi:hypothetical protein